MKIIDFKYPLYLSEKSLNESKVPASNFNNTSQSFVIRKIFNFYRKAQLFPFVFQDMMRFIFTEFIKFMSKSNSRIELGVSCQSFLDSRHSNKYHCDIISIIYIPQLL